jgi:hypothetical protein
VRMKNVLVIGLLALVGCRVNDEKATRILQNSGYTDIQLEGYSYFGCSKDDDFTTTFYARGPNGDPVTGAVCCGWLKNCTVRLD